MDFELSEEHKQLQKMLRDVLTKEASDEMVAAWDHAETFPDDLYRRLADLGLCGLTFGEEYGGSGPDEIALCIVVEELARTSAALAWAYLPTVSVCARAIVRAGSVEQRSALLPAIAAGTLRLAFALTEPQAGSDIAGLTTFARRDGEDFRVSGQKVFTTGADSADHIVVVVRTDPHARLSDALTLMLVSPTAPGIMTRPLRKMAGQAIHTCEVFFDDVHVRAEQVLGTVGGGAEILFASLDSERICAAAMGLGIAQGVLDKALPYAMARRQFGVPIIDHQAVSHMLADVAIDVDTARLLTHRAASRLASGHPCTREAAVAKVAATEIGTRCAGRGMQILGGYSYTVEYGMERYWRESKLYEIAAGTNQVLRNVIAKHLISDLR